MHDIIEELKKLMENSNQCAAAAGELMEKSASEENFSKAQEMKVSKSHHEMFSKRLQRVIDGKPAFEGSRKESDCKQFT